MNRILAGTSKVGGYTSKRTVRADIYFLDGSYWYSQTHTPTSWLSFKSPTQYSDGHRPTNYSRCILRSVGEGYDVKNGGSRTKCSDSFGGWLGMNTAPWGQLSLLSGSVNPSSYLRLRAISDNVQKMHGQDAFILEDLAQASQTARTAYDLLKQIGQKTGSYLAALNAAIAFWDANHGAPSKRGGPKRQRNSADDVVRNLAKAWLTWYYGVKPLISTLNALAEDRKPRYGTIRVKTKRSAQLDPSSLFSHGGLLKYQDYTYTGDCKEEVTVVFIVDVVMSDNLSGLSKFGFRPGASTPEHLGRDYGDLSSDANILTLGWALLPYSFVIDWFIPVESFLQTLSWSPGITYKGGYITDYMGGVAECTTRVGASGYRGLMPKGRVEAVLFQRETYHDVPPPAALAVGQSLSLQQSASGAALLALLRR